MEQLKSGLRRKRIVWVILLVFAMIAGIMLILPPGSGAPKPYRDDGGAPLAGSISEKIWVGINGFQQGVFLKGKDVTNPVLLFLSGGPGIPDYFLTRETDTGLEDIFTVCYWDYRATALSYTSDCKSKDCTTGQFVQDTVAVTDYLRVRFGQEKIYLIENTKPPAMLGRIV